MKNHKNCWVIFLGSSPKSMGKAILLHFLTQIYYDCYDLRRFLYHEYDFL